MKNKNLVLIGFMGCGKTTVGRNLSGLIKYDFFDCDSLIEQKSNMSISNIFNEFGESYFRNIEHEVIKEVSDLESSVIATGGGVIKNPQNMSLLKMNGIVIYLKNSPEKTFKNLEHDNTRPILQEDDKFTKISLLMEEREPFYIKYSDIIIDVSEGSVNEITEKILKIYSKRAQSS